MQKIELTKNQKKIFINTGICLAVFLFLLLVIYVPGNRTLSALRKELAGIEGQIQSAEEILSQGKSKEETIRLLKERELNLTGKFPQHEEESLKKISELARKANVDILSVSPSPMTDFLDADGNKVIIEGKFVRAIQVALEIKCVFKDMIKYIQLIKEDLPAFSCLQDVNIAKDAGSPGAIKVTLDINLYFLGS